MQEVTILVHAIKLHWRVSSQPESEQRFWGQLGRLCFCIFFLYFKFVFGEAKKADYEAKNKT